MNKERIFDLCGNEIYPAIWLSSYPILSNPIVSYCILSYPIYLIYPIYSTNLDAGGSTLGEFRLLIDSPPKIKHASLGEVLHFYYGTIIYK